MVKEASSKSCSVWGGCSESNSSQQASRLILARIQSISLRLRVYAVSFRPWTAAALALPYLIGQFLASLIIPVASGPLK
jgi:hypothetical protein